MEATDTQAQVQPLDPTDLSAHPLVLRCHQVRKRFGGAVALRDARLELRAGEIHALIGENGCGKSTLLNIISGQLREDGGKIEVAGPDGLAPLHHRSTSAVAIVTQELSLAPDLSVAENIMMGRHSTRGRLGVSWSRLREAAATRLSQLDIDLDLDAPVGRLRVDQQQMVEIARALAQETPILVLDEPTSSLTQEAAQALFRSMRRLREQGVSIVFVSHRLEELFATADRFTVMRDGVAVSTGPTQEYSRARLVHDMIGHEPEVFEPSPIAVDQAETVLQVEEVSAPHVLDRVSFDVRRGESVGLVGLSGAGQSELLEAMFGLRGDATGRLVDATWSSLPRSSREAIGRGMALVPNDRKLKGLFMDLSCTDNIAVANTLTQGRLRRIRRGQETSRAREWAQRFSIAGDTGRAVSKLSGGNQQKVLLSKWLSVSPKVLMLDEPTRGVDVGAKTEIHRMIRDARDDGMSLVVASSEVEELLLLCDRFIVMFRGTVVGELGRDEASVSRLTHMAMGRDA